MPINPRNTSQDWSVGSVVRVGFMSLRIIGIIPTPGDHRPDVYVLAAPNGKEYEFTPHHGLVPRESRFDRT